jgi:two-component system cell cycle sensor histidine kinase/response regulator CckA
MSSLQAGTMLAYLAGAAVFVCAVMAAYWSRQRVPPGFGLWTTSCALIAVACVVVAERRYFPRPVTVLAVPGVVFVAAVLRLEGLRRLLGRERFDRRSLWLPVVAVALLVVFAYAWEDPPARAMVTTVSVALVFWMMVAALLRQAKRPLQLSRRYLVGLFTLYGGLWLASGIHWLVSGKGFPLAEIDSMGAAFLACITAFELLWVVGCLVVSSQWKAGALEAARSSAERERRQLADIVDFLPDATFALDMSRKVIAWNRVAEEHTGVPASQVVGIQLDEGGARGLLGNYSTLSEVLLDSSKSVPASCHDVRREGDRLSAEEEWRSPRCPEKLVHLWHVATLLRDAEGQVTGTIESIRDITWRVEMERAMRESEESYRSLFEHSLDGILVLAPGGAVVDANPSACRMLGMTMEEIREADPGSLISWTGQAGGNSHENPILGTAVRELSFVRADGAPLPAECMSVVWNDSTGHLRAFVQFRDISERMEAQRILRESQERLLEAQAASRIGSWEIDLVGRSIWLSPEALRIFGLDPHSPYFPLENTELTGLSEDPTVLAAALEKVMIEGGSYDVEYSIRRLDDGALRRVHSIGAAICSDGGLPVKVVGITQDVSESCAVAGLSNLNLYAKHHSDEQVFWVDPQGKITNVSESACAQLGYTRDELTAMTIYEVNPTLVPGSTYSPETVKRLGPSRHETVHRAKDGRDIPVEVSVNYAEHEGEEYKFVVARDISERMRLEETLQRTQLSLGRGGDVILWADARGRLAFVTDAVCRKLGYSREELLATTIFDLDPEASLDWESVWAELGEQGAVARKTLYRAKDGTQIPMEVALNRVEHGGEEYALAVAREVGESGFGADTLARDEIGALQHEKLEAVGQLAGGIAHDFNNLLTAIIGYGNLILADEDAQGLKSLRRDAEEIRNAAERAAALTSQILAFARRQPLRPRKIFPAAFVTNMEERLRSLLTDDIQLSIVCSSEVGVVEVDTEQFDRVLVNLVGNAREAMPAGGRLLIGVENVELGEEYCRAYPELRGGSYVVISVSDTGVGMDSDTRMRIFEPFFTTKPPGEGAGLGLSVVYGVVRQSGGHVVAYSEVDRGTTLKVYLPRSAEPPDVALSEPVMVESFVGGDETIMVVEDEAPLRRLVARVLGERGYRVFVAGSGPEALELLEDMESPPDLLVTDVVLPGGLQGNELANEFISKVPGLPVLYMSGHPRDAIVHDGRLDEGVCFLGKPFTPLGLAAKVRECLDSNSPEE